MSVIRLRPPRMDIALLPAEWHPVVRAIYAARLDGDAQVDKRLKYLQGTQGFADIDKAVARLAAALQSGERILVYGDYDVDGATSTALAVRILRRLRGNVSWFVPQRQAHGYGLSIAGLDALEEQPALILTVDNGIASHDAVLAAKKRGIDVIVCDHHTPGETLPEAIAVINPRRKDSSEAPQMLAGVGVTFYLFMALQQHLKARNAWPEDLYLTDYLDLVALGTVADVVPLDYNNRILVDRGLKRLRDGNGNTGIRALCDIANLDPAVIGASDIAFALAPRLNALGRLGDMSDGVLLLLADDWPTVQELAMLCDDMNRDRKALEHATLREAHTQADSAQPIISAYAPHWHEGILGIIAGRLKSHYARPAIVACDHDNDTHIKASLRSVEGVNIHDLLHAAAAHVPGLQYGGHAMAAGLAIPRDAWPTLVQAMNRAFAEHIGKLPPAPVYIDGELPHELIDVEWARYFEQLEPWGAALPAPSFANVFNVIECKRLGHAHSRLRLREPYSGNVFTASWFFHQADYGYGDTLRIVYEMQVNRFHGDERLDLLIRHAEPYSVS
ncbi:MAG: single-stranded-DNA-specific exonuclease RecJ [Cardiobacteriaceae bacterium]|nr:single-stranded-DNA-specific exonuclease RecJ [Cardiobacteriaceae bacterium]